MGDPMPDDLVDQIMLERRGYRPLQVEVVRALTEDDLPALSERPEATPASTLTRLTHSHHLVAQKLVEGLAAVDVALITGYAPSTIAALQKDTAFQELLHYYGAQRDIMFVDVLARMRQVGLDMVDEIQDRLTTDRGKFTRQELLQGIDLLLVKPAAIAAQGRAPVNGGAGPSVAVNVKFVQAGSEAPVVDVVADSSTESAR